MSRRYRALSTTTLRAMQRALTMHPLLAWALARQIVAIEFELIAREAEDAAAESGGYLVAWILGEQ